MSVVRLGVTVAGSGGFNAGGGYPTLSNAGDLIGVVPLDVASSGLGGTSLNSGFATGATAFTPFGYGNALGQYGADQLSFAFSQGDYTASGATPQTFLQNQLSAPSSFSQLSAINQTMFSAITLQNNVFVTSAQPTDLFGAGYPFGGSYAGAGLGTNSGAFGVLSSFSPSLVPTATTTALDPGLANGGLTGTLNTIPTDTAAGLGVPVVGSSGAFDAANVLGAAHSATGLVTGSVAAGSSLTNGETATSGNAASGETALVGIGQAAQTQGVAHSVTAGNALLTQDQFSIKSLSADPFAHYVEPSQGHQAAQGAVSIDLYATNAQDAAKLAAAIGSDHVVFSDHVVGVLASHSSQAGDIHSDPVGHALPHTADVGGHLL